MPDSRCLARLIDAFSNGEGCFATAIPRLNLFRATRPTKPDHSVHRPGICISAQGRKRVIVGEHVLDHDGTWFLLTSMDVPAIEQILDATPEEPYFAFRLDLDLGLLAELILEMGPVAEEPDSERCVMLATVTPEILDAAMRLVALLATPQDIPHLAPLYERELLYRLLCGEGAGHLRQIVRQSGRAVQVAHAAAWIRENFDKPLRIEVLAREVRMSASALHHHFKEATGLSPLQYQKRLRLQEARRLILSLGRDAGSAAFAVGYECPSQFSREYSRLFGAPPMRDAMRLRRAPSEAVAV